MKVTREDWKGEAKKKISKIYIKNVPTTVMEEVTSTASIKNKKKYNNDKILQTAANGNKK
jgi:hypothetical protein